MFGSVLALTLMVVAGSVLAQSRPTPVVDSLPRFTQGTSAVVTYDSVAAADRHEVCAYDTTSPGSVFNCIEPTGGMSLAGIEEAVISGLTSGQTYGFYAKAYYSDPAETLYSDTIVTTMDAVPPDSSYIVVASTDTGVIHIEWTASTDALSGLGAYEVWRHALGETFSFLDSIDPADTVFEDALSGGTGLVEGGRYWYQIRPIDSVGNRQYGYGYGPLIPDSTSTPAESLSVVINTDWVDPTTDTGFVQGYVLPLTVSAPLLGVGAADSVRVQVARDDVQYFDSLTVGYFFDTGWLRNNQPSMQIEIDLRPDSDSNFVDGHYYFVRLQSRDRTGNVSEWSDTVGAYMDVFPPEDVPNFTAEPKPDIVGTESVLLLSWDTPSDAVSGLKGYDVYEEQIDSVGDTVHVRLNGSAILADSVDSFEIEYDPGADARSERCFRIQALDQVNNRTSLTSGDRPCARPTLPPIISADCDTVVLGTCYDVDTSVVIDWSGYDGAEVDSYYVQITPGTYAVVHSPATRQFPVVPALGNGTYQVVVRSFFSDGNVSPWSNTITFRHNSEAPEAVVDLTVSNRQGTSGNFLLEWDYSEEISGFLVQRRDGAGGWLTLDTVLAADARSYVDTFGLPDNEFTAFEHYGYEVVPRGLFGAPQWDGNAIDSSFCDRPPVLTSGVADTVNGIIEVDWDRAEPSLLTDAGQWYSVVRVICSGLQCSIDTTYELFKTAEFVYPVEDDGNYTFQVREIRDLAFYPDSASAWSDPLTVNYRAPLPAPDVFVAQPQPLPDSVSEGLDIGRMYIYWEYGQPSAVREYVIERAATGHTTGFDTIPGDSAIGGSFGFMDSLLTEGVTYTYIVMAVDTFGRAGLSDTTTATIAPPWVFTPELDVASSGFFKGDTVRVEWQWPDGSGGVNSTGTYGAVECVIELNVDTDFNGPGVSATAGAEHREVTLEGLLSVPADNKIFFGRIMAYDQFGNASPWSTEFFGVPTILLDDLPPTKIDTIVVEQVLAVSEDSPAQVDVYLNWTAVADRGPGPNGTGVGLSHYVVARIEASDSTVTMHEVTEAEFVDRGVDLELALPNCGLYYQVWAVDLLGNEQPEAPTTCVIALGPPLIDNCVSSLNEISWWPAEGGYADYFLLERAQDRAFFGIEGLSDIETEPYDISTETYVHVFDPLNPQPNPPIAYFRVKAVVETGSVRFESGWSEVAEFPSGCSSPTDVAEETDGDLPERFNLKPSYPNPFNAETQIEFELPRATEVTLTVYNILGQHVQTLHEGRLSAGRYTASWDSRDAHGRMAASGVYFYRLQADAYRQTRKMVLIR